MPKRGPVSQRVRPGKASAGQELLLRITVVRPPPGVQFCLQSGKSDGVAHAMSTGKDISFDFAVRVTDSGKGSPPRFLGPFTQGPPDGRFVYICCGTLAGQQGSCWTRRAKVPLTGIARAQVTAAAKQPGGRLEARFDGTAKDGGPSCATVPILGDGWRLVR